MVLIMLLLWLLLVLVVFVVGIAVDVAIGSGVAAVTVVSAAVVAILGGGSFVSFHSQLGSPSLAYSVMSGRRCHRPGCHRQHIHSHRG